MEHELAQQYSFDCLGCLIPKEFKECEWAFPAFEIPQKNGTIRFIIDFHQINMNLIRHKFTLWITEEILTSIKGILYAMSIDINIGYPLMSLNYEAK